MFLAAVQKNGDTALLAAVMGGHKDFVSQLIKKGADIKIKNNASIFQLTYLCKQHVLVSNPNTQ